jgi:four helix bundle protein
MPTIERFEDLQCWQSGRILKRALYCLTRKESFAKDRDLVSQVRRAAFSVTSNIAEGFERGGNRELGQFLATSKVSLGEIKDHLYTAIDEAYITQIEFDETYRAAEEAARLVGGFMSYLQRSEMTGPKFASRATRNSKSGTSNPKPETRNSEPGTRNSEPGTRNSKPGTRNPKL